MFIAIERAKGLGWASSVYHGPYLSRDEALADLKAKGVPSWVNVYIKSLHPPRKPS